MEIKSNKPNNNNHGKKKSSILLIILLLIVFGCVAFSMVLQRNTLIDWWIPTTVDRKSVV